MIHATWNAIREVLGLDHLDLREANFTDGQGCHAACDWSIATGEHFSGGAWFTLSSACDLLNGRRPTMPDCHVCLMLLDEALSVRAADATAAVHAEINAERRSA